MRLKLDENLPAELAADLRECGHDVETVVEENLGGRSDRLILVAAGRERRSLIALDKGLREEGLRARTHGLPPIVLLRLRSSGVSALRAASIRAIEELALTERFALAVVTEAAFGCESEGSQLGAAS
jgi:predicted nuclease of predicted toxin-antitoxin system